MSVCPACGADKAFDGAACARCGAPAHDVPELDLAAMSAPASKPRPVVPKAAVEEERIDLAVDLADLRPQATLAPPSASFASSVTPASARASITSLASVDPEAETLAHYGAAPTSVFQAPVYALRVWKRRAELRATLVGRREEASQAARATEDATCALGERVRTAAASDPQAARSLQLLGEAEDLLRARDATLAREQDQHNERVRGVEQRLMTIEEELVAARAEERAASAEVSDAQAAVQRAEQKLKRADTEVRTLAAQARKLEKTGA